MHVSTDLFDVPRCRARIAGMQDEELDEYILHIKTRLVNSHEDSYFLEESLLIQLGEACEEWKRRQSGHIARMSRAHHGATRSSEQPLPGARAASR